MVTYTYKLYKTKRTAKLDAMLREACSVWNHALALQKRYYSLFGGYINIIRLQKHFAKRIKRNLLTAQTVQEVLQRLDNSYKRFFNHLSKRPPKFKGENSFSSIVFKQDGYKITDNVFVINAIKSHFKFFYSRPIQGKKCRVIIKRSKIGDYFLYVITDAIQVQIENGQTHSGASVGMDFGLKTFLTLSDGNKVENPLFFKKSLSELRKKSKAFSKTQSNSNNHKKRKKELERCYENIRNRRDDWQWKTCHELCRRYATICVEDLSLLGMTRVWGRKVNDLAFGSFIQKLEHVASKYGAKVVKVDRFYPSSKTCSVCQYVNEHLSLRNRRWVCPVCGTSHDRDLNASVNILRQGIASSGSIRKTVFVRRGALSTGESALR